MPRLKCVGGSRDGYIASIDEKLCEIRLVDPGFEEAIRSFNRNVTPELGTYKYTTYTVRRLFMDGEKFLCFLAPSDWSDAKAIQHQFEK